MVKLIPAEKKIQCQLVYYGPPLSGKTTNIKVCFERLPGDRRGDLSSLETKGDRTLYFDFMPLNLGKIKGFDVNFSLYTVPGQVQYERTRKMVLQGVDGIVFVSDSHPARMESNLESLENLADNLREKRIDISKIPLVIQYNKRDLRDAIPVAEMEKQLNYLNVPTFEAQAHIGLGVFPTLKEIIGRVLDSIKND